MPSSLPSLSELRGVFRLLGECTELGADPILWREHFAVGCSTLISEHFVSLVESRLSLTADGKPKPTTLGDFHGGSLINERFELIQEFMKSPEKINPMVPATISQAADSVTLLRHEVLSERSWYRSHFYQDFLRPLGLNDQVVSVELRRPDAVSAICWLSYPNQKCTPRAARLLNLVHEELARLKLTGKLAPLGGFSLLDLSPRHREILYGIFQGDSEKQLALRLGISQHTVHDYLKRLHRRLGVRSRGELIHRCLEYWPALNHLQSR